MASLIEQLPTDAVAETRVAAFWAALTGETEAPKIAVSPDRATLAEKVPMLVDDVAGFLDRRGKIKRPRTLHSLMVYETLKGAFGFALLICMIVGADSISCERERSTLESLLLTPTSRRQIVIGKLLAVVTPWPACMLLCI